MSVEVSLSAFTLGPYVLGQRLGLGGMGEVYVAARADGAGAPVALKLLLSHLSEQTPAVEMFLNEARLAARMAHPNVVRILDIGVDEGRYYLAMELVQGVPLTALIAALARARTTLQPELVLHVAHGLFEGLHHAHTLRDEYGLPLSIVHRDISPQNVMVSIDGEVKVTDFGIAQAQTSPHYTAPGHVRGKCEYLSPEQARGESVDHRADIFSAAATLAHLATLRSTFLRGSIAETMHAAVVDPFPELLGFRPDLDPRFTAALTRAASKRPADRFLTAREACLALPRAPPDSASALGLLVRRLCAPAIAATLDASRRLETQTGSRPSMPVSLTPDTAVTAVPSPTRPLDVLTAQVHRLSSTLVWSAAVGAVLMLVLAAAALDGTPTGSDEPSLPRGAALAAELRPLPIPAFALAAVERQRAAAAAPAPVAVAVVESPLPLQPPAVVAPIEPPRAAVPDSRPAGEGAMSARESGPGTSTAKARRARASATAAPDLGLGFLTVDAVPWAEVWVDGRRLGETPIADQPVPAGPLKLRLSNPGTGREVTRTIVVRRGHEALVREDLR